MGGACVLEAEAEAGRPGCLEPRAEAQGELVKESWPVGHVLFSGDLLGVESSFKGVN